ncbi:hypothetical protein SARC_16162, partial [Sphaeroforma arctica JP610]
ALVQSADFSLGQANAPDKSNPISLPQMIAWGGNTAPRLYYGAANHIVQSIRSVLADCPGVCVICGRVYGC